MSQNNFLKNIELYKPAIYHFLDGYLDPNVGNQTINSINFLKNILFGFDENINILDIDFTNKKFLDCELSFHNVNSKSVIKYTNFNLSDIDGSLSNLSSNNRQFSIDGLNNPNNPSILLGFFEYCIIQISHDLHATSLLFFQKDGVQYLMTINSGLGINIHENFIKVEPDLNNQRYYLPYIGYVLDKNIYSEPLKTLKIIFTLISAGELYDLFKNPKNLENQSYEYKEKSVDAIFIDPIISIIKNIKSIKNVELDPEIFKINFKITKNDSNSIEIQNINNIHTIKTINTKFSKNIFKNISSSKQPVDFKPLKIIEGKSLMIEFPTLYYDFFNNLLINLQFDKFNYNQIELTDLSKFKISNFDILKNSENNINNQLLNKIILHYDIETNLLYILPQQSGSCSWFSIYWPVVLYNVLMTNSLEKYVNIIKNINSKCYEAIQTTFNPDTFRFEYTYPNTQFVYMKNVCKKLVDIGIVPAEVLDNQIDFIYGIEFNCKYKTYPLIINENILTNTIELTNIDKLKPQQIIEFLINNFKNNNVSYLNSFLVFVYVCFNVKPNLFTSNKINLIHKPLKDLIESTSFGNKPVYGKQFVLNYLESDEDITDLDNLIKQYNEVNNFVNSDLAEIKPSYFIEYWDTVNYFYEFLQCANLKKVLNIDKPLINTFDQIDLFIVYLHKTKLLHSILVKMFNIINNKYYDNMAIRLSEKISNFLFSNIISTIISQKINVFESKNDDQLEINFCKYVEFISPCLNTTTSIFKVYPTNIKNYDNIKQFLINNPVYMMKLFDKINLTMFIKLNIEAIFLNTNTRIELIKIFGKKYWKKRQNINLPYYNFDDIIPVLQLLFNKNIGKNPLYKNTKFNFLNYNANIYSWEDYFNILNNIVKANDSEVFISYLVENKDSLFDPIFKIKSLLADKIPNLKIQGTDILINEISFNLIHISNSKSHYSLISNLFIHDEYTYILLESGLGNDISKDMYLVNDKESIKLNCNFSKISSKTIEFRIDSVFYNNFKVWKFEEISYPFKNLIPTNCPHLIWSNNLNWYFTLFVNNNFTTKIQDIYQLNVLESISLQPDSYTFEINPITNLLSDKNNLDNFQNIILNYGANDWNIIYLNKYNEKSGFYFNYYTRLLYWNKIKVFSNKINFNDGNYDKVKIIYSDGDESKQIINIKINDSTNTDKFEEKYLKSLNKLLVKISTCVVNRTNTEIFNCEINKIISSIDKKLVILNNQINSTNSFGNILLNSYSDYPNYINLHKYKNICKKLLELITDPNDNFLCSQLKIYSELYDSRSNEFKYLFEIMFEIISGLTITEEQFERYQNIINNYILWENKINNKKYKPYELKNKKTTSTYNIISSNQISLLGGSNEPCIQQDHVNIYKENPTILSYPLHHFMMGKGKSSVITPLISIHLSLIYGKIIYIIVPSHLVKQTKETMDRYIKIFDIEKQINVVSDIEIKKLFLGGKFTDLSFNKDLVFLIDEFDSIVDPLKSNFNQTIDKNISITNLYKLLKIFIEKIKEGSKNVSIDNLKDFNYLTVGFTSNNIELIINDINNILEQINNKVLKENVNWGIHPTKCFAIPYLNKDKPLVDSNFSSAVLTIFLTLYYWVILKNYNADKFIVNFIINYDLISKIFNIEESPHNINPTFINKLLESNRIGKFNEIFDKIFSNVLLPEWQYNCSFIDIININSVYKIGYSGTLNINLPRLNSSINFNEIYQDHDEKLNINHAVLKSNVITNSKISRLCDNDAITKVFFDNSDLINYNAIIDIVGLFKNISNNVIANEIFKFIKKEKPDYKFTIIFLDENDIKYTIINNKIELYDQSINYTNPFFYYSQTHIIGIDLKQDNYPVLRGLCIVDNLTTYSEAAQSMFRLRKLNMGHTVDFLLIESDPIKSYELLELFNCNENKQKQQKADYLNYQVIKSEIRKYRVANQCFIDIYKETVKHYYLGEIPDSANTDEFFNGIFTLEEIKSRGLDFLFNTINNSKTLLKLVYNTNSITSEQQIEQEKENIIVCNVVCEKNTKISFNSINFGLKTTNWDLEQLTNLSICIDNIFRFLPNLFCSYNANQYYKNNTGIFFVWVNEISNLVIIPGYLIGYFLNRYPIIDHNLTVINYKLFPNIDFIDVVKSHEFFQIFNKNLNIIINFDEINPMLLFIATFIINNLENLNQKHLNSLKYFAANYTTKSPKQELNDLNILTTNAIFNRLIINNIANKINKQMYENLIQRINPIHDTNLLNLDNFLLQKFNDTNHRNKYLKYKIKYLELKNKLFG